MAETEPDKADLLWLRGGFPRSFTAGSHVQSYRWRQDFVATFLERDMPGLGIAIPSNTMERFWTMIAHYHAQLERRQQRGWALVDKDSSLSGL